MILLSCYIENYGTFSGKSIDFEKDLTVFCEENGYGKSTLVSFLKAMFYGLPSHRKTSKEFTERQHFYPFNGGRFGGNLTFLHEGKTYRVERFFDQKSDTKDECRIFCDTLETKEFGEKGELLGRSVFKLDEDSFKRTVFVENLSDEFSMTTDIGVALNRLVDGTDDDRNFEMAIKKLSEHRKALHTDRGNRGLIPDAEKKISELEERIAAFKNVQQKELESRYEEKREARRLTEEANAALDRALRRTAWDFYDDKKKEQAQKAEELAALKKEYPRGFPTSEERKQLRAHLSDLSESLADAKRTMEDSDRKQLDELTHTFSDGVPTQDSLAVLERDIREKESLKVEIHTVKAGAKADRTSSAEAYFQDKEPSEEALAKITETVRLYRENQMQLQSVQPSQNRSSDSRKGFLTLAVSGILLLLGLVCFAFSFALAIALCSIGAVASAFFALYYASEKKKLVRRAREIEARRLSLQKKEEGLRQSFAKLLSAYNYPIENDISFTFVRFQKDLELHLSLREKAEKTDKLLNEKNARLSEKEEKVRAFFLQYDFCRDPDDRQNLTALRARVQDYERLSSVARSLAMKKKNAEARSKSILDSINGIFSLYGIPTDASALSHEFIEKLSRLAAKEEELREAILALEVSAENYKKENKLDERPDLSDDFSLEIYREAQKQAQIRESELESHIRELEFELEELPERENELMRMREVLDARKRAYRTVKQTEEFLKKAEQNLKDRYVMPVYNSFCAYASELESTLGENVHMDKDFRIMHERGGALRSDKHLSAGQYAVSALCMRLALTEQIYGENLPFLILDDPFVHLDEKHLTRALRTVSSLAEKTQILYFTCHPSRASFDLKN